MLPPRQELEASGSIAIASRAARLAMALSSAAAIARFVDEDAPHLI
jgi:hypothetical protein